MNVKKKDQRNAMMKKYIISMVIGIFFLFALLPGRETNAAIYGFCIEDGVLTAYYGNDENVIIPDTVTSIGENAFKENCIITSVTIPDSVTEIGYCAFTDCLNLEKVKIGNSVTSIGVYAFNGCEELKNIEIPDAVESIGNYAFFKCKKLKNIEIPKSTTYIGRNVFDSCSSLKSISLPDTVMQVGEKTFANTPWLKTQKANSTMVITGGVLIDGSQCKGAVTISDTVRVIECGAFQENKNITSILIPDSVKEIGGEAFVFCSKLKKAIIGSSVKSIGINAFAYDSKLVDIDIPASVTEIGTYAFEDTAWLKGKRAKNPIVVVNHILIDGHSCKGKVTIPKSVTRINDNAFHINDKITEVNIPSTVKCIGNEAFWSCSSLKKINIPNSVTSIGESAFSDCAIRNITIPKSVNYLGEAVFYDCKNLTSVKNNSAGTNIPFQIFCGCINLKEVNIPAQVTMISDNAFGLCKKLTGITIPNKVKSIGNNAFVNCESLKTIKFSKSITYIGDEAFRATPWLENKKDKFVIVNHILIDGSLASGNVTLPASVYMIAGSAFSYNFCDMVSITIPNSVKYIGPSAFYNCTKLKKVTLPNSITKIEYCTFLGCESLTTIPIPDSVTSIGSRAFSNCNSLKNITLPGSISKIEDFAFADCKKLTTVNMTSSPVYIYYNAFDGCPATDPTNYIEILNKQASICMGRTFQLKADKYGNSEDLIWSVSDKSVATIDSATGLLTARKQGMVTVTAKCGVLKDSFQLKVIKSEQLTITGKTEIVSGALEKYQVNGFDGDKHVIWSISDENLAMEIPGDSSNLVETILAKDSGTVTLYAQTDTAQGELTITIQSVDIIGNTTVKAYEFSTYTVSENYGQYSWSLSDDSMAFLEENGYNNSIDFVGRKEGAVILTATNLETEDMVSIRINILYAPLP